MIIHVVLNDSRFDGAPSDLAGAMWRSMFAAELVKSVVLEYRPTRFEVAFSRDAVRHAVGVEGLVDHAQYRIEDGVSLILAHLDEETDRWMWMPEDDD